MIKKMKKIFALILVLALFFTLTGCKDGEEQEIPEKLVIWSVVDTYESTGLIDDFKAMYTQEGQKYEGFEIELLLVAPGDFITKVLPVMRAGTGAPDIIQMDAFMMRQIQEAEYFASLEEMIVSDEELDYDELESQFISKIWKAGESEDGDLQAVTTMASPPVVYFRTDIAVKVLGGYMTGAQDLPAGFISRNSLTERMVLTVEDLESNSKVSEWMNEYVFSSRMGVQTASTVYQYYNMAVNPPYGLEGTNYRLFAEYQSIAGFIADSDLPELWLEDGAINPNRMELMIRYTTFAEQMIEMNPVQSLIGNLEPYGPQFFSSMSGPVTHNLGAEYGEYEVEVGAFVFPPESLPMIINNSVADDNSTFGDWGIAELPYKSILSSKYTGIYEGSNAKNVAYDFIKFTSFNEDNIFATYSALSNFTSHIPTMEKLETEYQAELDSSNFDASTKLLGDINPFTIYKNALTDMPSSARSSKYETELNILYLGYLISYSFGLNPELTSSEDVAEAFLADVRVLYVGEIEVPEDTPTTVD
jgi:hypothetical protein